LQATPPLKERMRKNTIRVNSLPQTITAPATPERVAAAPEPEVRGLTRDELRRIVLDIVG
jgi:hypothetical protein